MARARRLAQAGWTNPAEAILDRTVKDAAALAMLLRILKRGDVRETLTLLDLG
jgi:hypothetical protein